MYLLAVSVTSEKNMAEGEVQRQRDFRNPRSTEPTSFINSLRQIRNQSNAYFVLLYNVGVNCQKWH